MFNPVKASKKIKDEYVSYITSTFKFNDEKLNQQFGDKLSKIIAKGPFVDLNDIFESGNNIESLINNGDISPLFRDIEKNKPPYEVKEDKYKIQIPLKRPLYKHQEEALIKAISGHNLVITTGTGSGKTECFIYPIINHLLREQEQGTLSTPGIRAILIYPMNALANDQIKRLRNIFMFYEEIKFGVFTGETETQTDKATIIYERLHRNEKEDELKSPLSNELISREQMLETPPHILITNYAELERLLFVPHNDKLFQNHKVKFVVLDEAHIYRGATGIETSMLLKRLRARLKKEKGDIQYFLTSATLGQKNKSEKEIVEFANRLTDEYFNEHEDVIFSSRVKKQNSSDNILNIHYDFFNELCETKDFKNYSIYEKYNVPFDDKKDVLENLYNACERSSYYRQLRNFYNGPAEIFEISKWLGIDDESTANFIFCCTKGRKDGTLLVDGRFHFFVRALEGCYMSFKTHELSLVNKEDVYSNDTVNKFFEIGMCHNCGDIPIIGFIDEVNGNKTFKVEISKTETGHLNPDFFHIIKTDQKDEEEELDDEIPEEEKDEVRFSTKKKNKKERLFWMCPICGRIEEDDLKPNCGHSEKEFLHLKKIDNNERCLKCNHDKYQRFYLGSEAPTSILAMSLFEQLPVKIKHALNKDGDLIKFEGGKQFLCFSDSRSEAAFFTSYEDQVYLNFIGRRGLAKLVQNKKNEIMNDKFEDYYATELVDDLTYLLLEHKSFADDLIDSGRKRDLEKITRKQTWMTVLDQMIGSRRKNSLQSLGLIQFNYLGNTPKIVNYYKNKYFTNAEFDAVKDLLDILAMSFLYFGAVSLPSNVDSGTAMEVYEHALFSEVPNAILKQKSRGGSVHYSSWIPQNDENSSDKWKINNRSKFVSRIIDDKSQPNINKFLEEYFDKDITSPNNEYCALPSSEKVNGYIMPIENYGIQLQNNINNKWYKCKKCGRISIYNIDNKCLVKGCDGTLVKINNPSDDVKDDYYYNVYNNGSMKKLLIKEHTAQLDRKTGLEYQNRFANNAINALSCSTTFEMGVDVGELETVFLRNVPPTTANYAQRAGRAGRSADASAFVLTYAKLSSHDFNYYENPVEMINGKIIPPVFKLDNIKIMYRHIFSVCLSHFFSLDRFEKFYDHAIRNFASNEDDAKGFESFKEYLNSKPEDLSNLLLKSFGAYNSKEFGIADFSGSWVNELLGEDGRLTVAIKKYRMDVEEYNDKINNSETDSIKAFRMREKSFYEKQSLIDFFVAANILPKYGFPVDTMELKQMQSGNGKGEELSLSRDISQGISDYAPGCKVVANDSMYTSRYINKVLRKGTQSFVEGTIFECKCGTKTYFDIIPSDPTCIGCGTSLALCQNKHNAIEPRGGMTMDGTAEKVPMTKPKRIYRSEEHYVGYNSNKNIKEIYSVNGKIVTIISSKNDQIMVTSPLDEPFYVCEKCGYALGKYDSIKDPAPLNTVNKPLTKKLRIGTDKCINTLSKHKNLKGKECENLVLDRYVLCHVFNTDIIQIMFNDKIFSQDKKLQYSLLYAILDSMAVVLGIERNDISGCLRHNNSTENTNITFVIFDNVPGGAGHVKRLIGNKGEILTKVISQILNKMDCECLDSCYSCLRSYSNQRLHPLLSHKLVTNFISNYYGKLIEQEEIESENMKLNFDGSGYPLNHLSWQKICDMTINFFSDKARKRLASVTLSNNAIFNRKLLNFNLSVCLLWEKEKVILLSEKDKNLYDAIHNKCDWNIFIGNDSFDNDFEKFTKLIGGDK